MLAEHVGLYDWLRAVHILAAITWVGGAIFGQVLIVRLLAASEPSQLPTVMAAFEWIGNRVFAPASIVLLGLGIWMVILEPSWTFAQFWVLAALGMFAYSFASGVFYLGPRVGRLKRMYDEQGPEAPEAPALIRRLFVVSRIELVLLILIVLDMVLKPGL